MSCDELGELCDMLSERLWQGLIEKEKCDYLQISSEAQT